jgi:hypothetical protein
MVGDYAPSLFLVASLDRPMDADPGDWSFGPAFSGRQRCRVDGRSKPAVVPGVLVAKVSMKTKKAVAYEEHATA